ncbi:MAG: hypothetical protein PVS3B3_27240 [Ktedonobacteraceae bacterium]
MSAFFVSSTNHSNTVVTQATAHTPLVTSTMTAASTPTAPAKDGMYIPGTYKGSMFNETTQQTTYITVFIVQSKGSGALSGSVTDTAPTQGVYPLSGTVDLQGNFSFSTQQPADQKPRLYFGTVQQQQGSFLHGNFCSSTTNTCIAPSGYFTVGPGY